MISIITNRLFVGDLQDAYSLNSSNPHNIEAILNVCEERGPALNMASLWMPFPDHKPIPIDIFYECMLWLESQYKRSDRKILIHCAIGKSRSPTICAAFMVTIGLFKSIVEAINVVAKARPQINPAPEVFLSAETYLTDKNSII